jgi:Na+-transporting NADH:ubiquinone oxidoreductase subunit A
LGVYNILQGHHIPLEGDAEKKLEVIPQAKFVSLQTSEFRSLKFTMLVKEGDGVKVGTPLCHAKTDDELVFTSTAAGKVHKIVRGPKRVLLSVVIEVSNTSDKIIHETWDTDKVSAASSQEIASGLKKGGVWPLLRQRPFAGIADASITPKAIFINVMATAPLAPCQAFLTNNREDDFALGLLAVSKFSDQVHLCVGAGHQPKHFANAEGVTIETFNGVHPAGLTGTHINEISPINKGETVWFISASQVALIGEYLKTGSTPAEDIIALTGANSPKQFYARVNRGAMLSDILGEVQEKSRIILGDVLNGNKVDSDDFISFYKPQVTIIPEGGTRYYPGEDKYWFGPGKESYSVWPSFLSKLFPKDKWNLDANQNGGDRTIVIPDIYEKYTPIDIHYAYLLKAIMAEDIDAMEKLGLYELEPEDVALPTFICPFKVNLAEVVDQGLALLEKEA